jgi:hypothetical protein
LWKERIVAFRSAKVAMFDIVVFRSAKVALFDIVAFRSAKVALFDRCFRRAKGDKGLSATETH